MNIREYLLLKKKLNSLFNGKFVVSPQKILQTLTLVVLLSKQAGVKLGWQGLYERDGYHTKFN